MEQYFQSGGSQGYAANTAAPSRGQLSDVDDAMDNLDRFNGFDKQYIWFVWLLVVRLRAYQ